MTCDICGKPRKLLGRYDDTSNWWICNQCFARADELAARENRWPSEQDYKQLKAQR